MPGEDGLSLQKETSLAVAMGDRRPRVVFDTRLFLLPRGQAPTLTLTTVNLSSVKLTLARLSERNVLPFVRNNRLGEPVESYSADEIAERSGRVVWEGKADIPRFQANRSVPHRPAAAGDAARQRTRPLCADGDRGDGTPDAPSAVQMIFAYRSSADGLARRGRVDGAGAGFSDVKPRPGVRIDLLAENNDILGQATTDADGVARFAAPLLHGTGPVAPRSIHVFGPEDDFTALDLTSAAFDLSDRGVSGQPHPGPLDAFVWLDRGIYRPGETVQVMALLRDEAGQPADIPARVRVKRPNGQVFLETVATADRRRLAPPPGHAVARRGRGHLGRGGAGRSGRAADRAGRVPRGRLRAGPHGRGSRTHPRPDRVRAAIRAAGGGALSLRRAGGGPLRQGNAAARDRPGPVPRADRLPDRA